MGGSWDRRAKGEGSGATSIPFWKEALGAVRLDPSLRGSVFLLSIINRRNQSGRIGVLAIVQTAGPNTQLCEAPRRPAQWEARSTGGAPKRRCSPKPQGDTPNREMKKQQSKEK